MVQCANAENVSFIDLLIFFFWGGGEGSGVNVTFFPFFNQIFSKLQVAEHFALILRSVWISDKTLCLVLDLASQTEKLAKELWPLACDIQTSSTVAVSFVSSF